MVTLLPFQHAAVSIAATHRQQGKPWCHRLQVSPPPPGTEQLGGQSQKSIEEDARGGSIKSLNLSCQGLGGRGPFQERHSHPPSKVQPLLLAQAGQELGPGVGAGDTTAFSSPLHRNDRAHWGCNPRGTGAASKFGPSPALHTQVPIPVLDVSTHRALSPMVSATPYLGRLAASKAQTQSARAQEPR